MSVSCLEDPQIPRVTYSGAPRCLLIKEGSLTRDPTPYSHTRSVGQSSELCQT